MLPPAPPPPAGSPLREVAAASVAEVAWRAADGPVATGVLPLVDEDRVVLALPYAESAAARALGAADEVLLAVTEPRGSASGWAPLALRCRSRLVEDPEGARFTATLLAQELLRWPPSRLLADSVLLRREHWWWLPRLLVELTVVGDGVTALRPREHPGDHLLVVDSRHRLEAAVVGVEDDPFAVRPGATAPGPGPAVLVGQDLSLPDRERWGRWSWRGTWDGAALEVRQGPGARGLPPVPGVWARWRRQQSLERACRRGLAASR